MEKCHISWSGRLAAYKILIFTKVAILFKDASHSSFLRTMQSMASKFIWKNQRARCPHSILIKSRGRGGMGMPDFKDYYIAALLDQLRFWILPQHFKSC